MFFLDIGKTSLEDQVCSFLVNVGGGYRGWQCVECDVRGTKGDMKKHVESNHITNTQVVCNLCGKVYKNRNSLGNHISLSHKENQ